MTRHLKRKVEVYEGEISEVDHEKKIVRFVGKVTALSRFGTADSLPIP